MAKDARYRWQKTGYASPAARKPKPVKTTNDAATPKQISFLESLCHERGLAIPETATLTIAEASMQIDRILGASKVERELRDKPTEDQLLLIELLCKEVGAYVAKVESAASADRALEGLKARRRLALAGDQRLLGLRASLLSDEEFWYRRLGVPGP